MPKLINLTPHDIILFAEDKKTYLQTIPSSGVARVISQQTQLQYVNGYPVNAVEFTGVKDLPLPQIGTIYIVSSFVLQHLQGERRDLLAPNTLVPETVRTSKGALLGITGFISISTK